MTNNRIVLAYSGGLKSSAAIPWLAETYRAQVVAVALDLGQGDDLTEIRQRALHAGAIRCHVIDAREEFARDFIVPSLKAEALLDRRYPMATALGRPVIAKTLTTLARIEEATTVAHAGSNRDQRRLTEAVRSLESGLRVIPCTEAWTFTPTELVTFAERHQITVGSDRGHVDRNLWGRTVGQSFAADRKLPEGQYALTRNPENGPRDAAILDIEFDRGLPIALNSVPMPLVELIDSLSTIGAEHGVGRLSRVKTRVRGRTSHAIYEAPAAVVLHDAHAALQQRAVPSSVQRFAASVAMTYADLIDRGEWFSDLRPALDAFVNHVQQQLTGVVQLRLRHGIVDASDIRQPAPLNL